jgi:hypothetical protein
VAEITPEMKKASGLPFFISAGFFAMLDR